MKKCNFKSILQLVIVLSVLAGLLLCLNGCKKKPVDDGTASTTTASTETTEPVNNTKPTQTTQTSQTAPTTVPTTPTTAPTTAPTTVPTEETVNNCAHVLGNWVVATPSTCTTEGSRYKACTLCKEKVETEAIPIVPHSASAWIVDKKATCTAEGVQHQECVQCKALLARIIVSKADHKTSVKKGHDATLDTSGLTQGYSCSKCGAIVQEQFPISPLQTIEVTYEVNADGESCTLTGLVNKENEALILPDAVNGYTITAIKDGAFSGCAKLKTVYLPDSVTSIGTEAFKGCTALTNVTYEGTTLQWITVAKGADWNANTGNFKVYCSNNHLSK